MSEERKADGIDFLIVALLWLMALLMFQCGGCASPKYSEVPPASSWTNGVPQAKAAAPKHAAQIELPPEPEAVARSASSATSAVRGYKLVWDYGDTNNIVFDVHRASLVKGPFQHWTNVTQTSVPMPTDAGAGYFIVRASNITSHLVSDWNR